MPDILFLLVSDPEFETMENVQNLSLKKTVQVVNDSGHKFIYIWIVIETFQKHNKTLMLHFFVVFQTVPKVTFRPGKKTWILDSEELL